MRIVGVARRPAGGAAAELSRRRVLAALVLGAAGAPLLAACGTDDASGTVLVAASLGDVVREAIAAAADADPAAADLQLDVGSSTTLATQVVEGRSADVLATADETSMAIATASGDLQEPVHLATNRPALIVPSGERGAIASRADLNRSGIVVSLCDPSVPCGRLGDQLLASIGHAAKAEHAVREADVDAVLQRVRSGEADAGVVYASDLVRARTGVRALDVPEADSLQTRCMIALGVDASDAAQALVALLLGADGRSLLERHGFTVR